MTLRPPFPVRRLYLHASVLGQRHARGHSFQEVGCGIIVGEVLPQVGGIAANNPAIFHPLRPRHAVGRTRVARLQAEEQPFAGLDGCREAVRSRPCAENGIPFQYAFLLLDAVCDAVAISCGLVHHTGNADCS